jgi:hypothetical protein
VKLSQEQRTLLEELVKKGEAPARKILHAQILLKSDKGGWGPRWQDKRIQEAFAVGETLVKRVRRRYVENGLEDALNRRKQEDASTEAKDRWETRSANHCNDVYRATRGARDMDTESTSSKKR